MLLIQGQRYLFMGQRYAFSGTVKHQTPTHCQLEDDAMVHYEDIGGFEDWSSGKVSKAPKSGKVPGQIVSMLGCDVTPIPAANDK